MSLLSTTVISMQIPQHSFRHWQIMQVLTHTKRRGKEGWSAKCCICWLSMYVEYSRRGITSTWYRSMQAFSGSWHQKKIVWHGGKHRPMQILTCWNSCIIFMWWSGFLCLFLQIHIDLLSNENLADSVWDWIWTITGISCKSQATPQSQYPNIHPRQAIDS